MLASLRLRSVRHALVIMLMILSGAIAVERAQAVVNRVQHALAIDHAAPTLHMVSEDHDHDQHHDQAGDDGPAGAGDPDPAPGPHHHHSDGPQIAALTSPAILNVALSRFETPFPAADPGSPQSCIFGLERPPKALGHQA